VSFSRLRSFGFVGEVEMQLKGGGRQSVLVRSVVPVY
jgi:hypothetical protein